MTDEAAKGAYNVLLRVPPEAVEERMYDIIKLNEPLEDTLLTTVDVPLKLETDPVSETQFIKCEFNRDYDSYRSPISNKYFPPLDDGLELPDRLRQMEIKANKAFGAYRRLYYQGGVSSVYLWEIEDNVFGVGVFLKNEVETALRNGSVIKGCIDSTDVIEVDESGEQAVYTKTSSVLLSVSLDVGLSEPLSISGSLSDKKAIKKAWKTDDDHIVNIGEFVENDSSRFRDHIEDFFVKNNKKLMDFVENNDLSGVQDQMASAFMKAQRE